jgi:uncharacterized protein YdiU (UPF0061 family)
MVRLCESFSPLVPDEARLRNVLALFEATYAAEYSEMLANKLGLIRLESDDEPLVDGVFQLLEKSETDFILFFRNLAKWTASDDFMTILTPASYSEISPELRNEWNAWAKSYGERIARDKRPHHVRVTQMNAANPKYVLRNYLAHEAITAAEKGDLSMIEHLLKVLKHAYDEQPEEEHLAVRRPEWARSTPGCSALSCSS